MKKEIANPSIFSLFIRAVLLIILAVFICVSIMTVYNMSFGWLSTNRTTSTDGDNAAVGIFEASAEYFAYVYDAKASAVRYTGEGRVDENNVNIDPTIEDLDMQFYDTIFKVRNRYTPAIVRIRLTNIKSSALNGGTVIVKIGRDTTFPAYDTQNGNVVMNEYMTSIMRFTLAQNPSWYSANANTLYDNLDNYLYSRVVTYAENNNGAISSDIPAASTALFTTVTKSGNTITGISKADYITLSIDYESTDILTDADDVSYLDIYLYVTYDATLIKEFQHSAGIDTDATTVGKTTEMTEDLASLDISFATN